MGHSCVPFLLHFGSCTHASDQGAQQVLRRVGKDAERIGKSEKEDGPTATDGAGRNPSPAAAAAGATLGTRKRESEAVTADHHSGTVPRKEGSGPAVPTAANVQGLEERRAAI